jgi:hypothetical protein
LPGQDCQDRTARARHVHRMNSDEKIGKFFSYTVVYSVCPQFNCRRKFCADYVFLKPMKNRQFKGRKNNTKCEYYNSSTKILGISYQYAFLVINVITQDHQLLAYHWAMVLINT